MTTSISTTLATAPRDPEAMQVLRTSLDALARLQPRQTLLFFDRQGVCQYASPNSGELFGLPNEELVQQSFDALHTTASSPLYLDAPDDLLENVTHATLSNTLKMQAVSKHSCRDHAIELEITKLTIPGETHPGLLASYRQAVPSRSDGSWRHVLDHLPFGTLVCSATGEVTYANQMASSITQSRGAITHIMDPAHCHLQNPRGERLGAEDHPVRRALMTGENLIGETLLLCLDKECIKRLECSVLHLPPEEEQRILFIFRDVSARYERASQKGDLLSIASHELRNPLTPLRGLLQMLQHECQQTGQVNPELIFKAQNQVERLVKLVDGLLDLSIVETGKFSYSKKNHDLREILDELLAGWCIRHGDERFELELPASPLHVHVDAAGIEQVINNLLDNAIKHSPEEKPIVIKLQRLDEEGQARVEIQDRGTGFHVQSSEHLFERFTQGQNTTPRHGSLGLGLYICKRIIEEHRGQIVLTSTPTKGTTVVVTLPMA